MSFSRRRRTGPSSRSDQSPSPDHAARTAGPASLSQARRMGRAGLVGVLALLAATGGCTRTFYRIQADRDAYAMVGRTARNPRWDMQGYTIQIPQQSRMYDPSPPDRPWMPLDDPAAHQYMHNVLGRPGYPRWERGGVTPYAENPNWLAYLPVDGDGVLRIGMEDAVHLALTHSTEYQQNLEELYLSALDVSFEDFRLSTQFFGGYSAFYTAEGPDRAGNGGESSSILELSTRPAGGIQARRLTAAGGDLTIGFANTLLWQLAGPNNQSASSLLNFSFIQPLLRGGGRDVILERLTLSQRTLLYNIRQMHRYRRGFYLELTTGENSGPGPSRRGGFFGGAGLEGFTGVGAGGFGRVGGFGQGGQGGFGGGAGGAGAQNAGGFLGLLQDKLNLTNQQANIAALRNSLTQLEAFFVAGRLGNNPFQVELARQFLLTAQSQWLNGQAAYQARLDAFKMTMGLPPQLPVVIEDNLLDRFNLIPRPVVMVEDQLTTLQESVGDLLLDLIAMEPFDPQQADALLTQIGQQLEQVEQARKLLLAERIGAAREDIRILNDSLDERLQSLEELAKGIDPATSLLTGPATNQAGQDSLDVMSAADIDPDRLRQLPGQLTAELDTLRQQVQTYQQPLDALRQAVEEIRRQLAATPADQLEQAITDRLLTVAPNLIRQLSTDVLELSLIHARARTESAVLTPVELNDGLALEIASRNRVDWMNARANLVDAWRLIQFNANNLESGLDVVFAGDVQNVSDNPFSLSKDAGSLSVGLQFDAPLARLSERNTYRQALIEFQQARRRYYKYVDSVSAGLRNLLRTLELNRINFELRRYAVEVAIKQVELARLNLEEPPRPGVEELLGATTARDLVNALSDLLNVQNDFLSVWVNYEVIRRRLDFDLGTMQLDDQMRWIDPGPIQQEDLLMDRLLPPVEGDEAEPLPPPLAERENAIRVSATEGSGPSRVRQADWEDAPAGGTPVRLYRVPGSSASGPSSPSAEPALGSGPADSAD